MYQASESAFICASYARLCLKAWTLLHQAFNSPPHPPSLRMRLRAISDPVPTPSLLIISQPRRRFAAWRVRHHSKMLSVEKNMALMLSWQPGLHKPSPEIHLRRVRTNMRGKYNSNGGSSPAKNVLSEKNGSKELEAYK